MSTDQEDLQARLVALTRDLMLIASTESRPRERDRCLEFLRHHLEVSPELQTETFDRGGHRSLVLKPIGTSEPEILLCGHIDVIDHPEADCYHSQVENGRIVGPGSGDMKGQVAILVELFRTLHRRHPGLSLGIALTSDEEQGGVDGVRYLLDHIGLRCGLVIIPDGGSLTDVTSEEKGVIHGRITCRGQEAHGARPWLGENAAEKLLRCLTRLRTHFDAFWPDAPIEEQVNHWFPTCSITVLATANETTNRIPEAASAVIDVRFPPPTSVATATDELMELVEPDGVLETLMTAEPTRLDPDPLFSQVTEEITGEPTRLVRASGGSDGRFFREHGIPVNLSRPLVGNLHGVDEWIDIASMVTYYRICETYIERRLVH